MPKDVLLRRISIALRVGFDKSNSTPLVWFRSGPTLYNPPITTTLVGTHITEARRRNVAGHRWPFVNLTESARVPVRPTCPSLKFRRSAFVVSGFVFGAVVVSAVGSFVRVAGRDTRFRANFHVPARNIEKQTVRACTGTSLATTTFHGTLKIRGRSYVYINMY